VSLGASARPKADLKSFVYVPPISKSAKARWKRPEVLAAVVMLVTLVLALAFA
jgi:hypothetical protein